MTGIRLDPLLRDRYADWLEILAIHLREKRVSHAYIFSGLVPGGPEALVKYFAARLLCLSPEGADPCGQCRSCIMMAAGTHPDFLPVGTGDDPWFEEGERDIDVGRIRQLQASMYERPLFAAGKCCHISRAERMNPQAQNCLLKLFEEPPEGSVIILSTSGIHTLLDTIRSRAVILHAEGREDVSDKEEPDLAADFGEEKLVELALSLPGADGEVIVSRSRLFEGMKDSKDNAARIMAQLGVLYRDMLAFRLTGEGDLLLSRQPVLREGVIRLAAGCRPIVLARAVALTEKARRELERQYNYQMVVDNLLMAMAGLPPIREGA